MALHFSPNIIKILALLLVINPLAKASDLESHKSLIWNRYLQKAGLDALDPNDVALFKGMYQMYTDAEFCTFAKSAEIQTAISTLSTALRRNISLTEFWTVSARGWYISQLPRVQEKPAAIDDLNIQYRDILSRVSKCSF